MDLQPPNCAWGGKENVQVGMQSAKEAGQMSLYLEGSEHFMKSIAGIIEAWEEL